MKKQQEKSAGGKRIYPLDENKHKNFSPPIKDKATYELVSNHIKKYFGEINFTLIEEDVTNNIHINIIATRPTAAFPYQTIVTSGMSSSPMNMPKGWEDFRYAEIFMLMPADWKLREKNVELDDENNLWPLTSLTTIAEYPQERQKFLCWGCAISNGKAGKPFAPLVKFSCNILLPLTSIPQGFLELKVNKKKTIRFYSAVPVYKEEVAFFLKNGPEALGKKFREFGISDVVDINRPNTCLGGGTDIEL